MKVDAAEQHDVAAQHPEVVKRFEEYFQDGPDGIRRVAYPREGAEEGRQE